MENYPIFQKEYTTINNTIPAHSNFSNYLAWAINHVQNIQFHSSRAVDVNSDKLPLDMNQLDKLLLI